MRFLNHAVAEGALPGEYYSGDLSVVAPVPNGALIAVIDGLGHGILASKAAEAAAETVRICAGEPLQAIMESCHKALRGSRGAVMTLAEVNEIEKTLTWMGVGNIEGRIWQAVPGDSLVRQAPPLRGGVLGHKLPKLNTTTLPLTRGDLMILSTDGISTSFHDEFRLEGTVQQIADNILEEYWMAKDDALVLVMRYLGQT